MDGFTKWINSAVGWKFLDEPYWKWLVFLIAIAAGLGAWKGVLRAMDE